MNAQLETTRRKAISAQKLDIHRLQRLAWRIISRKSLLLPQQQLNRQKNLQNNSRHCWKLSWRLAGSFVSAQIQKGRGPHLMSWPLPYRSWECRLRKQGGQGCIVSHEDDNAFFLWNYTLWRYDVNRHNVHLYKPFTQSYFNLVLVELTFYLWHVNELLNSYAWVHGTF